MKQIVLVLTSSYSGSTLLSFLLDMHPQVTAIGDFGVNITKKCSCGLDFEECPYWNSVFKKMQRKYNLSSPKYVTPNVYFRYQKLNWISYIVDRRYNNPLCRYIYHLYLALFKKRVQAMMRYELDFYNSVLETTQAEVLVRKYYRSTPLVLDGILEAKEYQVKFIHLVRDVRGFVYSHHIIRRKTRSIRQAAAKWRERQIRFERLKEKYDDIECLLIRYEDMCQHTEDTLHRMFDFMGVPPKSMPAFEKSAHHILGNRMRQSFEGKTIYEERWKEALTKKDTENIDEIVRDMAEKYEYHKSTCSRF